MEQLTKDQVRSRLVLPFGFEFEDLYRTERLERLDGLFLDDLGRTAPALRDSLLAARQDPASLAPKAHSTLILEIAPYLEDFLGNLFGIQPELDKLRARHSELAPIYAVKRRFVQRKAITGYTEEKATEIDGYALAPELETLLQEPLTDLSFATQVSRWLENETEIEKEHPFLKETLISAMGNVELSRLLDPRYLNADEPAAEGEPQPSRETLVPLTV